jgi:hypothetical protein
MMQSGRQRIPWENVFIHRDMERLKQLYPRSGFANGLTFQGCTREFQEATRLIAAMGQRTTPSHNEVVLMARSLGVSALVCLLNNGDNGQTETQANLLGPF